MTEPADLLVDGFGRVQEIVHHVVEGLSPADLAWRPGREANTIGWLVWHLARVQDAQVADLAGTEQGWTEDGWVGRFDVPFETSATGYGQDPAEVAGFRSSAELLSGYADAVHDRTVRYLRDITADALDEVADERWDPPVTVAVRLVSILSDDLQHAGQAAYARGLLDRR